MSIVEPFRIAVPDAELADLRARLRATRWPEPETVTDWSQGIPLRYMRELVQYWADVYDWRAREARLNSYPQFRSEFDGLGIHFYHVRSPHARAMPLLMTHGWPGSVVEFIKVFEPLTRPELHGGSVDDAFHVVCPSLPGYGFSDKPAARGTGIERIAAIWDALMQRLGYEAYVAQGGDWGAAVTTQIGVQNLGRCRAIHLNMPIATRPRDATGEPSAAERRAVEAQKYYAAHEAGYSAQQSTRPQTLGYGLVDSPAAQCAWIIEKFHGWTDCDGHPENILTRDELLDNVMLYWLPGAGASSARLYWESFRNSLGGRLPPVAVPTAVSQFAKELSQPPREWVERRYSSLYYWAEVAKGGHFAAFEQPALFVEQIRRAFASHRGNWC